MMQQEQQQQQQLQTSKGKSENKGGQSTQIRSPSEMTGENHFRQENAENLGMLNQPEPGFTENIITGIEHSNANLIDNFLESVRQLQHPTDFQDIDKDVIGRRCSEAKAAEHLLPITSLSIS